MPSIADVYAEVSPTLTPEGERRFTRALSRIDGGRAGVSIGQSLGKGMRVSLFKSVRGIAGPLAAAFATVKVGGFLKDAIKQASDLGETTSKTSVIFGKQALPALQRFSRGAAKALGQSQRSALDAAATFGVFGKSAGLQGRQLVNFSTKLTGLASDMASFANTSPEDAITALGAALRGESEPIRRYGVLLDDASLRQEAVRQGLIKTTKEGLTPQQKVLASYALILKQTKDAQGDFARTSDGLANQQRILSAQFTNFKSSIGQVALPLVTSLFRALNERGVPALKAVLDFAGRVSAAFRNGLGGDIPTNSGVLRYVALLAQRVGETWHWIRDTAVPGIVGAFTDIKSRIESALPSIDLSGIGKTFVEQAKGWGTALINGVKQGLDKGDWSGLGETVGRGLVAAIGATLGFARDVARKLGELFGKVDWIGLGITVGKQAIPFLVGFAVGLLNVDILGLLKGLAAHWQEAIIAVLALALAPTRLVGAFGRLLARIPLVGKFLETALLWTKGLTDGLVRGVGRALAFMGKAFLDGFRTVFPRIGSAFAEWLGLLPIRIGVAALEVRAAAIRMMRGLGNAIRDMIGWVVRNIGQLIAQMLRPWVNAGRWLVTAGINVLRGLGRGLLAGWQPVGAWLGRVGGAILSRFAGAGRWLLGVGSDIIGGLWAGFRAAMRSVGSVLGNVKDAIVDGLKSLFGIHSPSTVMAGIGGHIITGLIKGLLTQSGALARVVKSIGGNIAGIFGGIDLGFGQSTASGAMQKMVAGYASMLYGWTGAQWTALRNLLMGESGFNPNAQNPTSTAYGLFQFLDSTWAGVNATKTSNPQGQTLAGLRYIKQVYGSPAAAYGAWLSRTPHWYDQGGVLPPGLTLAMNGTGRAETVTTGRSMDAVVAELRAVRKALETMPAARIDDRYIRRQVGYGNVRSPGNTW